MHVLLGNEDRDARRAQLPQSSPMRCDDDRRQTLAGLVEQQGEGLPISVRAMASICCSPPESRPAMRLRSGSSSGNTL